VIKSEQPFVAEMPASVIAQIVPEFDQNLVEENSMEQYTVSLHLSENDNLLTVQTSTHRSQLASPQAMHRLARLGYKYHHEWSRVGIICAGVAVDALAPFKSGHTSEFAALLTKSGADAFDKMLQETGYLGGGDKFAYPSSWSPNRVVESAVKKGIVTEEEVDEHVATVKAAAIESPEARTAAVAALPSTIATAVSIKAIETKKHFRRRSRVRIAQDLNIWSICAVIANADLLVSTSSHTRIVAFACQVPRLTLDSRGKHLGFIAVDNYVSVAKSDNFTASAMKAFRTQARNVTAARLAVDDYMSHVAVPMVVLLKGSRHGRPGIYCKLKPLSSTFGTVLAT
jgi:hypothetical protein